MRTARVLSVFVMVLCLTFSAGCTGNSGTQQAATEKTNQSWTGSWMTKVRGGDNQTPMELEQTGIVVLGSYGYRDGTIAGTSRNGRLTGTWSEDNGQSAGPIEFILSDNGLSFTGWYGYPGENFEDVKTLAIRWRGWRI